MDNYEFIISAFNQLRFFTHSSIGVKFVRIEEQFEQARVHIERTLEKDNPVRLDQLVQIYQKYLTCVFEISSPTDTLQFFTRKLHNLYPHYMTQLQEYFTTYEFERGVSNILIKGDVQAGKTLMIILSSLCYLVHDRDVIVIVRNKLGDRNQFIDSFNKVVDDLKKFEMYTNKRFVIAPTKGALPSHACVFVEIYIDGNLTKLYKRIAQRRRMETIVTFIDEADLRSEYPNKLFTTMGKQIYVSATVQDILIARWNIKGKSVIQMRPPPFYKGIEYVTPITKFNIDDQDELFTALCEISNDFDYEYEEKEHPKIILMHIHSKLDQMQSLFDSFRNNMFYLKDLTVPYRLPKEMTNICCIKYTGDGIVLSHPSISSSADVIYHNLNNISETLNWLANNGGKLRFPNIVIIAGQLADRGIRFADPKTGWHLTHEILRKQENTSSACATQGCRILGVFKDNIPLKLYTTKNTWDKIYKGYYITENVLSQVVRTKVPEEFTNEICKKEVKLDFKDIPQKYLAHKNVKESFGEMIRPRGEYACAIAHNLAPCELVVYNKTLEYLSSRKGVWIRRPDIVNYIGDCTDATRARLKDIFKKPTKHFQTDDENHKGLLGKLVHNNWFLRLN